MNFFAEALRAHPELALFLALALGYALGGLKLGPIRLNVVIGVLISGVAVGQLGIAIPPPLQWAFFALFLFSIGYRTGPQFFRGLGKSALSQVAMAALLCGAALGCTIAVSRILSLDAGGAAGLLAGAMNASAALGTAGGAIAKLALPEASRQAIAADLAVAFAVTYIAGLVTEIVVLTKVGPWLMRVNLAAECRKLEAELGVQEAEFGITSAYQGTVARAYAIPRDLAFSTVSELERAFAPARVFAERIRTAQGARDAEPDMPLSTGDVIVLSGRLEALVGAANPLREHEAGDAALLDIPSVSVDVVLTNRTMAHQKLGDIGERVEREGLSRGVFVTALKRAGERLPLGPGTVVERGDVLTLVGAKAHVERVAGQVGAPQWPSPASDMVTVAAAIAIGGLVGIPTLRLLGVDIGLSLPVGILLGGMVVGWVRSLWPVFGAVPEPALWVFESLGLSGFLAAVGIGAGPSFINGLQTSGPALLAAGAVVCLVPNVVTILAGRYLLRIHPGILLGICAGAGTSPAGLAAVQREARSQVPTLGYGVTYAIGNILLALWGTVLVVVMAR